MELTAKQDSSYFDGKEAPGSTLLLRAGLYRVWQFRAYFAYGALELKGAKDNDR